MSSQILVYSESQLLLVTGSNELKYKMFLLFKQFGQSK